MISKSNIIAVLRKTAITVSVNILIKSIHRIVKLLIMI